MVNLINLAAQGRAKSGSTPWSNEELEALLTLESECGLSRVTAADYIRNGILTPEAYHKAVEKDFVPVTLEEAEADFEKKLAERGKEIADEVSSSEVEEDDKPSEESVEEESEEVVAEETEEEKKEKLKAILDKNEVSYRSNASVEKLESLVAELSDNTSDEGNEE